MEHSYQYESKPLLLLPMDAGTSEMYRCLRNRGDNRGFFFHAAIIEKAAQLRWFENYLQKPGEYMFSIFLAEKMAFIGGIGVYDVNPDAGSAEVGRIIIDREIAAHKGYGAKAIQTVSAIARECLGLHELYAYIYETNIASRKSFQRAGFSAVSQNDSIVKYTLNMH